MSEKSRPALPGEVRVRSNVCTDPNAVNLVPWVLARTYWPDCTPTPQQKEELAYLQPCSLCKRRLFEIHEFGCDHHVCLRSGVPSVAEAERLRGTRYEDALPTRATLDISPATRDP
jgi:hypothetical protein